MTLGFVPFITFNHASSSSPHIPCLALYKFQNWHLNYLLLAHYQGFDPDSSTDVILRDSVIDTGDDGISIKSQNSTIPGCSHIQVPARNIHIYRTKVLSRNFCVGSQTFGAVYDLVMEDCEIGDDAGSSPWAIKCVTMYKNIPHLLFLFFCE